MKLLIFALLLGVMSEVLAAPSAKETRFFSGIYLLQSLPGLSNTERALKFRELEILTGIDAKKAEKFLSSYDAKPAEWQKICDSMIPIITGAQGKMPAPTAPKDYSPIPGARR
jgi:hypothetical protein